MFLGSTRPLYFCAPKKSQNTLYIYTVFRPFIPTHYAVLFQTRIEISCRVIIVIKNWLICDRCASLFFPAKILSEDPYLKSFIRRVLCLYCERFCSFSRYATRPRISPYFLTVPHSTVSTKAVKKIMNMHLN